MGKKGVPLPYDAEVEYLFSNQSAYINLGIPATNNMEAIIEGCITRFYGALQCMLGANSGATAWSALLCSSSRMMGLQCGKNGQSFYPFAAQFDVIKTFTIKINGNTYYISDGENESTGTFEGNLSTTNLNLFAGNNNGVVNFKSFSKIRKLSLKIDGATVFDMKSVRIGQVGYMYDQVSGELFGSSAADAFVVGPDK